MSNISCRKGKWKWGGLRLGFWISIVLSSSADPSQIAPERSCVDRGDRSCLLIAVTCFDDNAHYIPAATSICARWVAEIGDARCCVCTGVWVYVICWCCCCRLVFACFVSRCGDAVSLIDLGGLLMLLNLLIPQTYNEGCAVSRL